MGLDLDNLRESEVAVIKIARQFADYWTDKDDDYWLKRLMQEVGELAGVLAGDHDDTIEHELEQISSIAINWRENLRNRANRANRP